MASKKKDIKKNDDTEMRIWEFLVQYYPLVIGFFVLFLSLVVVAIWTIDNFWCGGINPVGLCLLLK